MSDSLAGAPGAGTRCDESAALREQLAAADLERSQAVQAAAELERRLDEAVNVCVALERLHGTTDRAEVLRAIQDVVINLVGSEELAIYEPSADGFELLAVQTFGVGKARMAPVRTGHGPVGRAFADGRAWVIGDERPSGDPDLTACVPLVAEGKPVAVVAVWRLLPHKPALRDADRRVLQLLGPHGGNALYLTSWRAGRARAA